MNLIEKNIIETYNNTIIKNNILNFCKKVKSYLPLGYPSLLQYNNINYIYYREDIQHKCHLDSQITKRFIIDNNLKLIKDENYSLNLGVGSHNFRLFNINNNIYGIGGQAFGTDNYNTFTNTINIDYLNYHKNDIKFISKDNYHINHLAGDKIYDPTHYCPYFANGLYLFKMNNINTNDYIIENNKLPILSGIISGRHDGHYGYCNNNNIKKSRNGLTVYDSNTSLIFNENINKYFLFQRANIGNGVRYIQYSSSNNLTEWSDWNLLKLSPSKDYFKTNIYTNNIFKIKGVNNYIGILQVNKKVSNNYYDHEKNGNIELYYSIDCENWNLIGNIGSYIYYKKWMVSGEPLLLNNQYYFFIQDNKTHEMNIYSIEKNRFSFITPENKDGISSFIFKPLFIKNKKILLNFKTFDNGYLKIQILDENKNIINNYSYDNFDTIWDNRNEFEFPISWNNSIDIFIYDKVYIEIIGKNFEIYSIE
jgi:hypothetical protein